MTHDSPQPADRTGESRTGEQATVRAGESRTGEQATASFTCSPGHLSPALTACSPVHDSPDLTTYAAHLDAQAKAAGELRDSITDAKNYLWEIKDKPRTEAETEAIIHLGDMIEKATVMLLFFDTDEISREPVANSQK